MFKIQNDSLKRIQFIKKLKHLMHKRFVKDGIFVTED